MVKPGIPKRFDFAKNGPGVRRRFPALTIMRTPCLGKHASKARPPACILDKGKVEDIRSAQDYGNLIPQSGSYIPRTDLNGYGLLADVETWFTT